MLTRVSVRSVLFTLLGLSAKTVAAKGKAWCKREYDTADRAFQKHLAEVYKLRGFVKLVRSTEWISIIFKISVFHGSFSW